VIKHKNRTVVVRRAPLSLSVALAVALNISAPLFAQSQPSDPPKKDDAKSTADANQAILDAWKAAGGVVPELKKDAAENTSKLDWSGSAISFDLYRQDVTTGTPGNINTPLATQDVHKTQGSLAVRRTEPNGDMMLLQAAMLASNSRAVLSKYTSQISTFQLGRTTTNYQVAAGDVTASFSPLGSSIGLRGLTGQVKLGKATLSAHAGTIAESWEAMFKRSTLDNSPTRNTYLRDVFGVKAEYAITPEFTAFVTSQAFDDRDSSLQLQKDALGNTVAPFLKAAKTNSNTVGLTVKRNALQLTTEVANSRFEQTDQSRRSANAFVVDGTYQINLGDLPGQKVINTRFGYHKVRNGFVTLGGAAQPGVEDFYVGADWPINQVVTWGTEVRTAKQLQEQTNFSPAATRRSNALTNRLNFNLQQWVQGLSFALSDNYVTNRDSSQVNSGKRLQDTWNANVNYSVAGWNLGTNIGWGKVESLANAFEDSKMRSVMANAGRTFMLTEATNGRMPTTLGLNFNLGEQRQKVVNLGTETKTNQLGMNLNGSLYGKWTANFSLNFSDTTQTVPGPKLKQKNYNFDLSYAFTPQANLRGYWRQSHRNQGSALLDAKEEVAGVNFNMAF
jgi:hypothetical protein